MDIEGLLRSLKEHKVDFVIIGATAFPVYGYARSTLDIDIFIRPTMANAEKTWKALKAFGYDVTDVRITDLLEKKLLIRQYAVETDVHPFVKGVKFEEIWRNKIKAKFGDTFVYFPSLNDIIKMKRAARRPKDLEDLRYLSRLKKNR
jgi:predicted nucleotidyltransferase